MFQQQLQLLAETWYHKQANLPERDPMMNLMILMIPLIQQMESL